MGKFEQHVIQNALFNPLIWWRFIDGVFMIWAEGEQHLKDFLSYLNSIHPNIKWHLHTQIFFMEKFEQHAIQNALFKPLIWWRFIDDVFMVWTEGEQHLKDFISYLNSIHPNIKFTHEYSNAPHQTLPFLDVQVHLSNNHIQTALHTKPTDKHQYLLKTSCHPKHTKQTIPFSLFLRIRRICSTDTFFDNRSEEHIKHLVRRGYSRSSLQRAIPSHATLQPQEQKTTKTDRTPFVISFNLIIKAKTLRPFGINRRDEARQ